MPCSVKSYWIWGIVATLCVVILCFGSGLYVRNNHYEVFLITHIVLSVITVVGCWYHAYDLYALLGGYCYWIYAVSAVWAFDRVARTLRIWIVGSRRSTITELNSEAGYVRIDVPDIRWSLAPGRHAYLYFPSLSKWTPWESHPFSIMPTVLLNPSSYGNKSGIAQTSKSFGRSDSSEHSDEDVEKSSAVVRSRSSAQNERQPVGLTFFIKKGTGFTKLLQAHQKLLTLIEGPYPNNSSGEVLRCDRLLLIAGGIGITAIVPFIASHWNVKLSWSIRESAQCLVKGLDGALSTPEDKEVRVGERLDFSALLAQEAAAGWKKVGVVISGPPSFCDAAKVAVITQARSSDKVEFQLEVEVYSW